MWESMGPIADRSHDKLGSSDRAIFEFRKQMLAQARSRFPALAFAGAASREG